MPGLASKMRLTSKWCAPDARSRAYALTWTPAAVQKEAVEQYYGQGGPVPQMPAAPDRQLVNYGDI